MIRAMIKPFIAMVIMLGLSGCQATMISYNGGRVTADCPPVVRVTSFGNSVTVTDGSECKRETKK